MSRLAIVSILLLAASCPRGQTPSPERDPTPQPTPRRPSDSTREGAVVMPFDETSRRWELTGTLDSGAGDEVDWLVIELRPRRVYRLDVAVSPKGRDVVCESELYREDGELLEQPRFNIGAGAPFDTQVWYVTKRLFIRVAATGTCRGGGYLVSVEADSTEAWDSADPPCDRNHYKATNPNCAGKCDYHNPDGNNPDCCDLWDRCRVYPERHCLSREVTVEGSMVSIPLGTRQGVFGEPFATLDLSNERYPSDEQMDYRLRQPIQLEVESIEPDRSQWRIMHPRRYDLAWVQSHASQVRLERPLICRQ